MLKSKSDQERQRLTEYIRRRAGAEFVLIDSNALQESASITPPPISERIERGIEELVKCCPDIGKRYGIGGKDSESQNLLESFLGATYSISSEEVVTYLKEYQAAGYLAISDNTSGYVSRFQLTLKGYQVGDARQSSSQKAFVAMWFSDSMRNVYDAGFAPAIRDCGYRSVRIDFVEHNNKIDDEIIANIRGSKFLVADFTAGFCGHSDSSKQIYVPRGGVYFEAGYALAYGLPVIWTCHADVISQVHFDTRQFNHIVWDDPADLKLKLTNRILATIGEGPLLRA